MRMRYALNGTRFVALGMGMIASANFIRGIVEGLSGPRSRAMPRQGADVFVDGAEIAESHHGLEDSSK
jgi:hypothetical protein